MNAGPHAAFVVYLPKHDTLLYGFNRQHQIIQWTGSDDQCRRFKTAAAARKYVAKYEDAGYGLVSGETQIVDLDKLPEHRQANLQAIQAKIAATY